jgi:hypothetical protein
MLLQLLLQYWLQLLLRCSGTTFAHTEEEGVLQGNQATTSQRTPGKKE